MIFTTVIAHMRQRKSELLSKAVQMAADGLARYFVTNTDSSARASNQRRSLKSLENTMFQDEQNQSE